MRISSGYRPAVVWLACALMLTACRGGEEPDIVVITIASQVTTLPAQGGFDVNDGTGEGEDRTQITLPLVRPLDAPEGITDLVLVTGQSNALGADTGYDPVLDSSVPRFYAWTSIGWKRANLRQVWDLGWHPRGDPDGEPHNNLAMHFGRILATDPNRVIGIVLATAPGEGISHWDYGSSFYSKISDKAVAALNELPHKSNYDGILWHQGETDWVANGSSDPDLDGLSLGSEYYSQKLGALISNFRSESWFSDGRPFICGETARAPLNFRLRALNTDDDPWTACADGEGLSTYDSPENVHFSAEALRELGRNYAEVYRSMTDD